MNSLKNMPPTRKLIAFGLMTVASLAIIVVLVPYIVMAIGGLLGLGVAVLLGLVLIYGTPYAAMKAANLSLKARKKEASENPIETLQNQTLKAKERLDKAYAELETFATERRNFEQEVSALSRDHPEDAREFAQQVRDLQALHDAKKQACAQAAAEIKNMEAATKRASAKWKVAQSAIRMHRLTGQTAGSAIDEIMKAEALGAVQSAMNRAMAQLDTAMAQNGASRIEHNPSQPIDVSIQTGERHEL